MKELKCPHCGNVFTVDESDYVALLGQVRNAEANLLLRRFRRAARRVICRKRGHRPGGRSRPEQELSSIHFISSFFFSMC